MSVGTLAPPPLRSQLVDKAGLMTREFNNWLRGLVSVLNNAPSNSVAPKTFTSVANPFATSALVPSAPAGVYRLSYALRIHQAATTSSSVAVTLQWTTGGVGQTFTGPALTGNTTTSSQSISFVTPVDGGSLISYATTYVSVGGTPMTYDLTLIAEAIA